MRKWNKILLVFSVFATTFLFAQNERLIIGRTTGKLAIDKNTTLRTFGFTNTLSGQVTLPGFGIDVEAGDPVNIDFWNISQGNPVSLYCKEIEFEQRDKENGLMKIKEPIHHMEHGFYSFQAQKPGTYLYYSPENYPFNLQAGMFGVIIIRPKTNDAVAVKPSAEVLWCSYEIDPKWHTDAIMGTEYDDRNIPIVLPVYKPEYFLVNGKTIPKTKGLQTLQHKKETVLLRLVNSGLYVHEIGFPSHTKLQFITGKETSITAFPEGYKVVLHPGECLEVLAFLENVSDKELISYQFTDPVSNKISYKAAIPVFYSYLNP